MCAEFFMLPISYGNEFQPRSTPKEGAQQPLLTMYAVTSSLLVVMLVETWKMFVYCIYVLTSLVTAVRRYVRCVLSQTSVNIQVWKLVENENLLFLQQWREFIVRRVFLSNTMCALISCPMQTHGISHIQESLADAMVSVRVSLYHDELNEWRCVCLYSRTDLITQP